MPTYPAARLLVSADPPVLPDDFQIVRSNMVNGLPHYVDLTKNTRLKIVLPTGLLQPWLDSDPSALAATSEDEKAPHSTDAPEEIGGVSRPALRFAASIAGATIATAPFALGARRTLRDDGDPATGAAIEVALLDWRVYAGTVRGPGDFGSYVQFGWRVANRAVDNFGPPVINPFLWHRLIPILRIESDLGLMIRVIDTRFVQRRYAIRESL
ncbi:hypothetical protein [Fimbriimonas ginsengisoli]|uniref:Uncharacterized protein n=1 Tax=Fimbriimonas ginsengisoli Gsoil 348 TaxID=661478 RepID=A0A068NUQ2_FIMGI|nr:hypothetical protein [Fimbriimonas ginsengisoli]AIE86495.1 hypothetical protein OP10G_3127 [Fimbriimonas ginsengisoli Gsoil 348]